MANPSRYRQVNYIGGRILEARELALMQFIDEGKDASGNKVSAEIGALYRQGAAFNINATTVGTVVSISPANSNYPMMVFLRDRWEIITGADFTSLNIGSNRTIYLNYSLRIVTSAEDPALIDVTTGQPTANMGELDLSFSITDTSATTLNGSTQLEKNTVPIVFLAFQAGGPPLVPAQPDNANVPAYGGLFHHGLVRLTTNTSAGTGVASDDPILNSNRNPNAGSVVDLSVRTPGSVVGQTNTDGSARYDLTQDPGGINSDKIIVQTVKERLTDYLATLLGKISTLTATLATHIGVKLGSAATHPMPTYVDVGAAPLSHTSLVMGVAGSHPPVLNTNAGGWSVNQTAVSNPGDLGFGIWTSGTKLAGIQRNGDFFSTFLSALAVAPGGGPITFSGPIGTLFQAVQVLRDHVNQTSGGNNPHGITQASLGITQGSIGISSVRAGNGSLNVANMIIKWGHANDWDGTSGAIALGFPNACVFAMGTDSFGGNSRIVSTISFSASSLTLQKDGTGNGAYWFALGY
jgi:hypothetical protein